MWRLLFCFLLLLGKLREGGFGIRKGASWKVVEELGERRVVAVHEEDGMVGSNLFRVGDLTKTPAYGVAQSIPRYLIRC